MKTKSITKITSLLLVIVMCLMTLVGCATNIIMPDSTGVVLGNGGLAVQKGEYIYFVNGYQPAKEMENGKSKFGENYSAIYRVKTENGALSYDENGNLNNAEIIIKNVCGFEKTGLYIFGDYIYYASPNTEKVIESGELSANYELTNFYKAKLDGTNIQQVGETKRASDKTQFAFYKSTENNVVYLAVYDGTALYVFNTETKSRVTICEDVSSVALPIYTDYNPENNQISKGAQNVYYTRSGNDEENLSNGGNVLCYAKITDGDEHVLASDYYTYTVKFASNEALVLTRKAQNDYKANNFVFEYEYDQNNNLVIDAQNGGEQLDATGNENIYLCTFENGMQTGIVVKNSSNKLVYINYQSGQYRVLNETTELTPLCVYGTKVYAYTNNNSVYQIDYKTGAQLVLLDQEPAEETEEEQEANEQENEAETENEIAKPYFSANKNFSVLNGYVYYFATYEGESETGYYLNRVKLTTENQTPEVVAVVQNVHVKTSEK